MMNVPQCSGDHCITCSDEAVEVTVLAIDVSGSTASVSVQGQIEDVDISLVDTPQPGQRLLVHGGVALTVLDDGAA